MSVIALENMEVGEKIVVGYCRVCREVCFWDEMKDRVCEGCQKLLEAKG